MTLGLNKKQLQHDQMKSNPIKQNIYNPLTLMSMVGLDGIAKLPFMKSISYFQSQPLENHVKLPGDSFPGYLPSIYCWLFPS